MAFFSAFLALGIIFFAVFLTAALADLTNDDIHQPRCVGADYGSAEGLKRSKGAWSKPLPHLIREYTSLKIGWTELNNVQEAGYYPFRDGVITILELEIAIWRKHADALFTLMRKNPIRDRVEYVLGKHEVPSGDAA